MSVVKLTSANFDSEVMASDKPVLIDFYADWCGPCRMVSPIVDEIANERQDVKVCKVNCDEESSLAAKFGIMSIPALFVVKNGEVTAQNIGAVPKDAILKMIAK